jgi:polysaccharide biosynthesis/export protein
MDTVSGYSGASQGVRQPLRASTALRGVVVLSAAIGIAACTNTDKLPPAPPEPLALGPSVPLPPYRIQVGDVLDVRLILNPELNEEVTVRPDGHISTTVVRDAMAAGLTVPELDQELVHDYSRDLSNPRLSVVVRSFAPTRVYVAGEVTTPGEFITVGPTLTLSQAIARAGGVKLSSDETDVFIIRRGPNDKPEYLSVRYRAVEHATEPGADVRLAPYDVVYVPKSGIAEVYKWYNQYVQQFANPSFGFSYILNNPTSNVITTPAAATPP